VTPRRYTGLSPQRVSKDAKYTVTAGGSIRLEFQESQRIRILLTTDEHSDLTEMVNEVKRVVNLGIEGGQFYINEFGDVLVPDGQGGPCFWAGHYDGLLEFEEGSLHVSPIAPQGLQPGEKWQGPHVGIPYVLIAGATDIRYEKINGRRREAFYLSDFHDVGPVRSLARRLGEHKGTSGGRFFINEHGEFFSPVGVAGDWEYLYLGHLDEDVWFNPPSGFERP
jgi:hypothetical protein